MDDDMYDDEDDEVMDNTGTGTNQPRGAAHPPPAVAAHTNDIKNGDAPPPQQQQQQQARRNGGGGNRLSDQVDMDDEPELKGYERYVGWGVISVSL